MTRQRVVFAGVLVTVAMLVYAALAGRPPRRFGDAGTNDFIEYWAANAVAAAGGNPYAPAQLVAAEHKAGRLDAVPLMMWNPPWLLTLMRPVLRAPFGVAASTWMGINVVLVVLSAMLIASGFRLARLEAIDLVPALLASILSVPAVMSIQLGQVSLVLLLGLASLYWALRRRQDAIAGVALALLSVKPHLFGLVVVLVAIVVLREKRWGIVFAAAAALGVLLFATVRLSPSLLLHWWQSVISPPIGAPAAFTWRTPNLPNLMREFLARWSGTGPLWPLTVVPTVAVVVCALWLWRASRTRREALDELLPPVICLSVIAAPFGWTFDHVVLAVPQVIIFVRAFADISSVARRWMLIGATVLCHLGLVVQSQTTGNDYFGFWWFPPAILAVWLLSSAWLPRSPPAA